MSVKLPISHTELMNCVPNKGNLEQVQLTNDLRCELWNSNPDLTVRSDSLHFIFLWLIQWCTTYASQWNVCLEFMVWNFVTKFKLKYLQRGWLHCSSSIWMCIYTIFTQLRACYMHIIAFSPHEWTANEKKSFIFIISKCHGNVTVFFHRHWNLIMFERKMVISKQLCFFENNRPVDCILRTFNLIWDGWCNVFACSISIHILIVTMMLKCFLSSTQLIDRVKKTSTQRTLSKENCHKNQSHPFFSIRYLHKANNIMNSQVF